MSKSAYRALSDVADHAYRVIYNMTPRQRKAALKAIEKMSTTNCVWNVYEMRHAMRSFILMATPVKAPAAGPGRSGK